jgi:hypothetical protein
MIHQDVGHTCPAGHHEHQQKKESKSQWTNEIAPIWENADTK